MTYVRVPCEEAQKPTSTAASPETATSSAAGNQPAPAPYSGTASRDSSFGIEVDWGRYGFRSPYGNWTGDVKSVGGEWAVPIDSSSSVQLDGHYSRLDPGQGAPDTNAWDGDANYIHKFNGIPVGGFVGGFSNNGASTWGGGLEAIVPLNSFSWETQAVYAHTGNFSTDLWGGRTELRYFPTDDVRLTVSFGAQHTSSTYVPGFTYTDNVYSCGLDAEARLFNSPWCVFGDYEHTHFNSSGLNADGVTLGMRYYFGGTLKERETQGPAFTDFSKLLGVGYKF